MRSLLTLFAPLSLELSATMPNLYPNVVMKGAPSLTAMIYRLEAATSRLEDMAMASSDTPLANGVQSPKGIAGVQAPSLSAPPPPPPPAPAATKAEPLPEVVEDFDTFISTHVTPFVRASEDLGGAVAKQV